MEIHIYAGHSEDWSKLNLTEEQIQELNLIGYYGKKSGWDSYQDYLDTLNNGHVYTVKLLKHDEFSDLYEVEMIKQTKMNSIKENNRTKILEHHKFENYLKIYELCKIEKISPPQEVLEYFTSKEP